MSTKTWIILQATIWLGLIANWFLLHGWAYKAAASILVVLSIAVFVERSANMRRHFRR